MSKKLRQQDPLTIIDRLEIDADRDSTPCRKRIETLMSKVHEGNRGRR